MVKDKKLYFSELTQNEDIALASLKNEDEDVTFIEHISKFRKLPVGQFHLYFHFRNGWNGFWEKLGTEDLTAEEQELLSRILATINRRWSRGCNSDMQLFLLNLKPNYQTEKQWYSIVASENHNMVIRFGRNFGNIDYPVVISVYR